jgi:hypothetical protein
LNSYFGYPNYVAVDGFGNVYVSDHFNSTIDSIRRLSLSSDNVTTIAGKTGNVIECMLLFV